jgi:uncharacterized cupin superfamily protein
VGRRIRDGAGKTHLQRKNQELFSFLEGKSRILKEKKKKNKKKAFEKMSA